MLAKLDRLLQVLQGRIFTDQGAVPVRFRRADHDDRAAVLAGTPQGWTHVTPDLIWGEPESYFWFAADVTVPPALQGRRVVLRIEAAFGSTMGRSDPQCLVRVDGQIVQGADGNHREVLLQAEARPGTHSVLIEAGTIESRRQLGFGLRLMTQDLLAETAYYDLKVPLDVARHLGPHDPRRSFLLRTIDRALRQIDLRPGNLARFHASLTEALTTARTLYQPDPTAPTITATGHTHIDVAWLWRVRETRQKMARSMATALRLMEDFPDYRFMYNQGVLLDYLSQDYPEIFSRIKSRVAEGRFEIEGALWLEPDVNIAGGEALVRHMLRGIAYHQDRFGIRPRMVWLPDTFGYSAALPQLMEQAGLDTFVTHKLSWNDTNRMPYEVFRWQGIDGTQRLAYFLTTTKVDYDGSHTTYCPDLKPTHVMGAWKRFSQKSDLDHLFLVYGHGDGGGGPTREMLENIRRMERGIPGCPRLIHGPMRPYFQALLPDQARFPVWAGELYLEYHRGTLTSVASVKRQNRLAEERLREVELLACLDGGDHRAALRALWDILLLNQFHDILPGSSVGAVYADADADYARLFAAADALEAALLARIGAGEGVLNTQAHPRAGLVQVPPARAAQVLVRPDGSRAPVTLTLAEASGLSPLTPLTAASDLSVSPDHLENRHLRAEFSAGHLTALYDKTRGRPILQPGTIGNRLIAFQDLPLDFDAWDIDAHYTDVSWPLTPLGAEVVETGPLRAALRVTWRYEASTITQIISLQAGADLLEFDTHIDWHEHQTLLKAEFPLAVRSDTLRAQIQFGHVSRPTHRNTSWDQARFESPMQRWIDLSEPAFGVALLNDCKYGYDALGHTLRLTLLKSATFPWAGADQGAHRFAYAIMGHDGQMAVDAIHRAAEDFAAPLRLLRGPGKAARAAMPAIEGTGVTMAAVKPAEDGQGQILRLYDHSGAGARVRLTGIAGTAQLCDLLEANLAPLAITEGAATLEFRPFQIMTLRLLPKDAPAR